MTHANLFLVVCIGICVLIIVASVVYLSLLIKFCRWDHRQHDTNHKLKVYIDVAACGIIIMATSMKLAFYISKLLLVPWNVLDEYVVQAFILSSLLLLLVVCISGFVLDTLARFEVISRIRATEEMAEKWMNGGYENK